MEFEFRVKPLIFAPLFKRREVRFFDGHTPGQMLPYINYGGRTLVYTSDMVPTAANIPLLWVAAYDLDPVKVMEEKEKLLEEAAAQNHVLFFEHDFYNECATVEKGEKGFKLKEMNPVKFD